MHAYIENYLQNSTKFPIRYSHPPPPPHPHIIFEKINLQE